MSDISMDNSFKQCPQGHYYSADLDSCPYCGPMRCRNCGWENPIGRQRCEKCNAPLLNLKSQLEGISTESPSWPLPDNAMCYCSFPEDYRPIPEQRIQKHVMRLGRASDNDVVINDSTVSDQHVEIRKHYDGRITLRDLYSTHGTYVNGQDIELNEVELHHGDIVKVGDVIVPWEEYFSDEA